MPEVLRTQTSDGTEVEMRPGDTLVIQLPEYPTTGYRWTPEKTEEMVLVLETSAFLSSEASAIGGGGTRALRFRARHTGTVELQLNLRRAWERDQPAVHSYRVKVRVV